MADALIDVTGIGNAIVDVLAHAEDPFLAEQGLHKGSMTLIDAARADELYGRMGPAIEISGGSCANTTVGIASLGGRAAYLGKVADDQLGQVFTHDIRAAGVAFDTRPLRGGAPTARSLILVTPDAQRTMNTYLGACRELGPDDIDERLIERSQVTYMEGYLWDPPLAKQAFRKASEIARRAGRKTALSLSDPFCVERHRSEFLELLGAHVDIVFGNERELCSLYEVERLEDAIAAVRGCCEIAVVTRSEHGSIVLAGERTFEVAAHPVAKVVDSTGAGDQYAAGFLFGYTHGRTPTQCAQLGSLCAAEVISHFGARPEASLKALAASALGA